jgi:phospholipid-binding lipoprotein MlaA
MSICIVIIAAQLPSAQPALSHIPPSPSDPVANESRTDAKRATSAEQAVDPSSDKPTTADDTIVVTGRSGAAPGDPLEKVNIETFAVVQSIDKAVTGPVARSYKTSVPSPVRSGLRNVLRNLEEPVVFLNYLLQLRPGKSAETLGRFAINSTIGGAGLFDVAKKRPFNLPHRTNGFAYTLGYYGVQPGPYMYLPLIGPTTVRDLVGRLGDISVLPVAMGKPFNQLTYVIPTTTVRLIDERAEADDAMRERLGESTDLYSTIRADYLRRRQTEIDALHERGHEEAQAPSEVAPSNDKDTPPRGK